MIQIIKEEIRVIPDKLEEELSATRLRQLRYVASILAALPYDILSNSLLTKSKNNLQIFFNFKFRFASELEPLLIIYTINRMVALHGGSILKQVQLCFIALQQYYLHFFTFPIQP
jgi:hypothetical protein